MKRNNTIKFCICCIKLIRDLEVMNDPITIHPENVAGLFYVTDECIDCGLCFETAPDTFRLSEDGSQSVVYRQPTDPEELSLAEEALEGCPVEAIEKGE